MKKNYAVLPEYAPLYGELPYHYEDYEKVSIYLKGNRNTLQQYLPKEFVVAGEIFEVFILKNNKVQGLEPYNEGGIIVPVKYKDIIGACMIFEYVDRDDALCAGREIWGYPKKMAEVNFDFDGVKFKGSVIREGKKIIEISFAVNNKEVDYPNLFPRLQVKRFPKVNSNAVGLNEIIKNNFYNAFNNEKKYGEAEVFSEYLSEDPISNILDAEVIGGIYVRGGFTLSFGEVIDNLTK